MNVSRLRFIARKVTNCARWARVFACLLLASLLLSACRPDAATPPEVTRPPVSKDASTWVQASFGEPQTLDPALGDEPGAAILAYVYDTLIIYNKDDAARYQPGLAREVPTLQNGGISADGLTYTFHIRPGVKFHDGSPLTAEDVAFTFQRGILQGGRASPQWLFTEALFGAGIDDISLLVAADGSLYDNRAALIAADPGRLAAACERVKAAVVPDSAASTVTFHLANPWSPFLASFPGAWGSVLSKAWVKTGGGWDGDCATWPRYYATTAAESAVTPVGSRPVGSGPYRFDHWTAGEEIVLVANPDYWRAEPAWEGGPAGPPVIGKLVYRVVDEFSSGLALLKAGDADYIDADFDQWPVMDTLVGETCDLRSGACQPTANPARPLRLYRSFASDNRTDLVFNYAINPTENTYIGSGKLDGNGIPPDFFSDIHIRKAFAYCFDYEAYEQQALKGEAARAVTLMLPGMEGYDARQETYHYDPARCAEEFQAAEIKGPGGAAVWETGFRLTLAYNTGNSVRQMIAQVLQRSLSAVNEKFEIQIIDLPWTEFLQAQLAGKLPLFPVRWMMDVYDSYNWIVPYTSGTYADRQRLPELLQTQFRDLTLSAVTEVDPAKRAEKYATLNQLYYEQVPGLLLYQIDGRRYLPRYVEGFYYNPILSGVLGNYVYALREIP